MPLSRAIGRFLGDHQLHGKTLVVAVSGGADSVALLHAVHARCGGDNLIAAHLNHQLRGRDALRDALHVETIAGQLGVRFVGGTVDVPAMMKADGISAETAARTARYTFLHKAAVDHSASWVLTAHHADDQLETIVFNFLRGSGITGLRGMRSVSPIPYAESDKIHLARPLLAVSKEEILTYCRQHALLWVEDESNKDIAYSRNRIRHELLPMLGDYSPTLRDRVAAMANTLAADDALLNELTEVAFGRILKSSTADTVELNLEGWRDLHLSLRRRVLRYAIGQLPFNGDLGFGMLDLAEQVGMTASVGAEATLQSGWVLLVGYTTLSLRRADLPASHGLPQVLSDEPVEIMAGISEPIALADGWWLSAEIITNPDYDAIISNDDLMQVHVSIPESGRLFLRTRNDGERVVPLGSEGSRKIKKVMIDRKVSAELRARWPIIATNDQPIWIPGHLLDDRAKIQPTTTMAIRLNCYQAP